MSELEPIPYSDAKLRSILERVKTIAMVGASPNWNRPSYFVMKYLQGKGYRVIPVNPAIAGQMLLGEKVYASLTEIPEPIDMVDVFRASDQVPPDRRGGDRHRGQGGLDAARHSQRRGGGQGRGRRPGSDHEPLPQDRVRPAGRRALLERGQLGHHPQPPGRGAEAEAARRIARRRRATGATASRPARCMPGPHPIR